MTASVHLAAGAAVGLGIQKYLPVQASVPERIVASVLIGAVSHVLLDAFPHWEYTIRDHRLLPILLLETAVVFLIVLSSSNSMTVNVLIFSGMAGGALPDVIDLSYEHIFRWQWLGWLGSLANRFHGTVPMGFEVGLSVQILLTIASILFVRLKSV